MHKWIRFITGTSHVISGRPPPYGGPPRTQPEKLSTMTEAKIAPVSAKTRRRFVAPTIACLAALVAATLILPWVVRQAIGPARLRAVVEDALTEALHRKVAISGDVSLIVVPWFGLSIGPLTVADDPASDAAPMLRADHTEVTIRILPLLTKVVSTGTVRMRGLTLLLRRDASGHTNWGDLLSPSPQTTSVAAGWQVAPQPRDVHITDASVTYADQRSGRTWTFSQTRFVTGIGQPFKFSLAFRAQGPVAGRSLECLAEGTAFLDKETGLPLPQRAKLTAIAHFDTPIVPGGASPTSILSHSTLAYDPDSQTITVSDLDAQAPGLRLVGSAKVLHPAGDFEAETSLTLTADLAGGWRDILGLAPTTPQANLTAQGGAEPTHHEPAVAHNEALIAEASHEAGQAVFTLAAKADAAGITLQKADARFPVGAASASGALVFGDTPRLDLSVSATDLDTRALPFDAGERTWSMPLDWLSTWQVDARLDMQRCAFGGLPITDFHATFTSGNGHARLYPVSMLLPEGLADLDARLERVEDRLGVDATADISPISHENAPAAPPSRLHVQGRVGGGGGKGSFAVQSPNPQATGRIFGLLGLSPAPLACQGNFEAATGAEHTLQSLRLTDLETTLLGTTLRGQLTWDKTAQPRISFDLTTPNLDADKLAGLVAPGGAGDGFQAEGKLRADRLTIHGIEAQNVAENLSLAEGRFESVLTGGELFGGHLSGKASGDITGKISAALQLAGAEAAKLPGNLHLAGAVTAKGTLDLTLAETTPRSLQATLETQSPRLEYGRGAERSILVAPKVALTLASKEPAPATGDDLPLDAALTVTSATAAGLSDLKLGVTAPLLLEKTGRIKNNGPAKLEASGQWRAATSAGRNYKLALSGPLHLDVTNGGLTAGELRADIAGLPATVKIWRKAGENASTQFSLTTGAHAPRQVLAGWGVALPAGLAADRLAKGSLSLTGEAGENGLTVSRINLAVDDTTLGGRATFPKYDLKNGRFDLTVDRLDCDAYFPPAAKSSPEDRRKPFDLRLLRDLSLDARVSAGWLKRDKITFGSATITATARDGVLFYRQESPQFYGGRFFAEVRGDARGTGLAAQAELKIEGFDCASFLRDWSDGDTFNSGGATFVLAVRGHGASEEGLRETLTGNARLQITRGDFNVHDSHQNAKKAPPESVPFDLISSSWISHNGVARTEDFLIESPRMQVHGKGQVDLREESINLAVLATMKDNSQAAATIVGPLDDPKLTIDRGKMFGDMLYRVLQGIISIPGRTVTHIFQLR